MASAKPYRVLPSKRFGDSSSEEGQLSSDDSDDNAICEKRIKICSNGHGARQQAAFPPAPEAPMQTAQRKRNNIWGSVIADQSSNDISSTLGTVGMARIMARGPESFSLELAVEERRRFRDCSSSSEDDLPENTKHETPYEQDIENYLVERHLRNSSSNSTEHCGKNNLKRKRPQKKKKPGQVPKYQPGQKVKLNRKLEVSADDSEEKVANELSFRLWEKKKDLIRHLIATIGIPTALFLYEKTEALELNGGLMTMQGNRRRTPGGTFLHLLRKDESIDQERVNKVFEAETLREKEQWMAAKQAKKQSSRQHNVGETPHNSPSASCDLAGTDTDALAKNDMDCNLSLPSESAPEAPSLGLASEELVNSDIMETFG